MHILTSDTVSATSDSTDLLLSPLKVGALELPNRVIMAPMTRMRSDEKSVPTAMMVDYYAQRASAGLVITEGTAAGRIGDGYGPMPGLMPGLWNGEQQDAWRAVVEAVHANGGRIAAQLWHVGHPRSDDDVPGRPVGWAIADEVRPHDLSPEEVRSVAADFGVAARRARDIGFDSVEVHAGTGNLLDRFLRPTTNVRSDAYGATAEGRTRIVMESIEAVAAAVGADRTGVKISPFAPVDGHPDPGAREAFAYLLGRLAHVDLAYVHANRLTDEDRDRGAAEIPLEWVREHYNGTLMSAGGFTRAEGEEAIASGLVDAVVYGRPFLANPDLPARFAARAPLNDPHRPTFYTQGPEGLVDYQALNESAQG